MTGGQSAASSARVSPYRDSLATFEFYADAHRAALVGLTEAGLVDAATAARIAGALSDALRDHENPGSAESNDYADLEVRLMELIGPEASLIHLGRSRQDLLSAANHHALREGLASITAAVIAMRETLLTVARAHAGTVIPRYTHAVPAQPTTFGHYLLAYSEAFQRVTTDLLSSYHRVNRSPLGASVLATSRFGVDRERVADLLGFDGISENSYGANHVAPIDAIQSALHPLVVMALHVSQLVQDVSFEQPQPHPWLTVATGDFTAGSSAMPQKHNPLVLERLREDVARILGAAQTFTLLAHNVPSGMTDSRDQIGLYPDAIAVDALELLRGLLGSLEIDVSAAEQRVADDYSTATEIADLLVERSGVPFRIGHRVAAAMVEEARRSGLRLAEVPPDALQRIHLEHVGQDLTVDPAEFAAALDPRAFVESRRGRGGPAPIEVARMLDEHDADLELDRHRLGDLVARREAAAHELALAFTRLTDYLRPSQHEKSTI